MNDKIIGGLALLIIYICTVVVAGVIAFNKGSKVTHTSG